MSQDLSITLLTNTLLTTTIAVLQLSTNHDSKWECTTCCEQHGGAEIEPFLTEDRAEVCTGCITTRFTEALESDYSWPPRWGGKNLDVLDYTAELERKLIFLILQKEVEFAKQLEALVKLGVAPEAVEGQIRGKDYQLCPKCHKVVGLADGSNSLVCPCMEVFCFICGREAKFETNHWIEGRCPKYGQPNSEDAEYDGRIEDFSLSEWMSMPSGGLPEHEPGTTEALIQKASEFDICAWVWNVTMQSTWKKSSIPNFHRIMWDQLEDFDRYGEWHPSFGQDDKIVNTFKVYSETHQVSKSKWKKLVKANANELKTFLTEGPTADEFDVLEITRGLLKESIGGVFNMAVLDGRLAAFKWMYDAIIMYDPIYDDSEWRKAVFDMGPGGSPEERHWAAKMLLALSEHGAQVTDGRFRFTRMSSTVISVYLECPRRIAHLPSAPWECEAFWRMQILHQLWDGILFATEEAANAALVGGHIKEQ